MRKPAISTQLKTALAKIDELEKKIKELEKLKQHYYGSDKANASIINQMHEVLNQMHEVLDAVPGSIDRKTTEANEWQRTERSVVTRMAAWLASKSH